MFEERLDRSGSSQTGLVKGAEKKPSSYGKGRDWREPFLNKKDQRDWDRGKLKTERL